MKKTLNMLLGFFLFVPIYAKSSDISFLTSTSHLDTPTGIWSPLDVTSFLQKKTTNVGANQFWFLYSIASRTPAGGGDTLYQINIYFAEPADFGPVSAMTALLLESPASFTLHFPEYSTTTSLTWDYQQEMEYINEVLPAPPTGNIYCEIDPPTFEYDNQQGQVYGLLPLSEFLIMN